MRLEAKKYLYDIQQAAGRVAAFTAGKGLADYEQDAMLRAAVERQFEIIGEALGQAVATNSTRSPREDARRCAKALLPLDAPPRMRMERRADSVRITSMGGGGGLKVAIGSPTRRVVVGLGSASRQHLVVVSAKHQHPSAVAVSRIA